MVCYQAATCIAFLLIYHYNWKKILTFTEPWMTRSSSGARNQHRVFETPQNKKGLFQTITLQTSECPQSRHRSQHSGRLLFNETAQWESGEYSPPTNHLYWNAQELVDVAFRKCVQRGRRWRRKCHGGFFFSNNRQVCLLCLDRKHCLNMRTLARAIK